MKKSLVALAACSILLLSCSDSGSDSTDLADLCNKAPKLTKGCLEGSWQSVRFEAEDGVIIDDATSFYTGGVLTLTVSNPKTITAKEELKYSSGRLSSFGYWQIAADSSQFQTIECSSGDCLQASVSGVAAELIGTDTLTIISTKAVFEGLGGVYKEFFVRK